MTASLNGSGDGSAGPAYSVGTDRIRPAGERAILVELPALWQVLSLQAELRKNPLPGQRDVVAAAATVLVTADSTAAARRIAAHVRTLDLVPVPDTDTTLVVIETVYDGEDLDSVGDLTGLGRDGVVAAHTRQIWTAAFGGFSPGFAYLTAQHSGLEVPRRESPRTAVPAGSVALAGAYSAVYPRPSPGGWQLIGRTTARMWDLGRENPALIRPGNRVRFAAVRARVCASAQLTVPTAAPADPDGVPAAESADPAGVPVTEPAAAVGLAVVRPGLQATIQDLGRPGCADMGVTGSGAMDRGALRRANRLAGNREDEACVEVLYGGLVLRALTDQVLAVTGAPVALTIRSAAVIEATDEAPAPPSETRPRIPGADGHSLGLRPAGSDAIARPPLREVPDHVPFALLAGETLELGQPAEGLRSYLAVRGGFDIMPVLGSRSTDTMSGVGPEPLAPGTLLPVRAAPPTSVVGGAESPPALDAAVTELHFLPGPRDDWFSPETLEQLGRQEWTVTAQSNRIGLRLDGDPLLRRRAGELPSEGTVRGALQVPPEGHPVLFLADHPVTGGYPVIGVVVGADLDKAAQLPPGHRIRLIPTERPAARPSTAPLTEGSLHA